MLVNPRMDFCKMRFSGIRQSSLRYRETIVQKQGTDRRDCKSINIIPKRVVSMKTYINWRYTIIIFKNVMKGA
ncbi:hypothetical protein J2X61_003737 [Bacillus sp. 3255]|nr:hypothetical protein [Bacillus sp. 3255]